MRRQLAILAVFPLLGLVGCQSQQRGGQPARVQADAAHDSQLLEPVSGLVGEWDMTDETGAEVLASRFEVTGGGSAVCETMFPGTEYQMTNLYHMDGQKLVVTHYCAVGNQPRMAATKARRTDEGLVYEFKFQSVSNLRPEHDHYMGQMTMTICDNGTVRQDWRSYDREGALGEPVIFELRRR